MRWRTVDIKDVSVRIGIPCARVGRAYAGGHEPREA
ncbi:MAG: hypothetical protein K0S65_6208 [Labilithrix sp.]|nr:hypothetical protein [Labilithrix sp.]